MQINENNSVNTKRTFNALWTIQICTRMLIFPCEKCIGMWARRQKAPKQKANYKMHYKFKDNQRKATAKSLSAQTVLNSVEWCVHKTVNIYLTLTKCNSQFYFFGWKCIYCCVRVWGSSVRSCFLTLCYRIVLSRSVNSRVCASLLMCECMCVGVFNAASNKPTKTVVAVAAAGKANTKLVPLAAVSVGLVAECYGIAPALHCRVQ